MAIEARPRGAASALRLLRARVPAEKWSQPCVAGEPAAAAFGDATATSELVAALAPSGLLSTRRTPAFLAWRYGFGPLRYRVLRAGPSLADGAVVFRLRRRGAATEAAIADVLVPGGDRAVAASLCRRALGESGADYLVRVRMPGVRGCVPIPGQGPTLVQRVLEGSPSGARLEDWRLSLGDVELF